jgi:hypothetical protein
MVQEKMWLQNVAFLDDSFSISETKPDDETVTTTSSSQLCLERLYTGKTGSASDLRTLLSRMEASLDAQKIPRLPSSRSILMTTMDSTSLSPHMA